MKSPSPWRPTLSRKHKERNVTTDNLVVQRSYFLEAQGFARKNLHGHPDYTNLIAVSGWLAVLGHNPSLIAAMMGRTRPFVYKRIRVLAKLLAPLPEDG